MILSNSCVLNERYTIQSVLGEVGPLDVNYLAWDLKDEKEVVIREYYPVRLAKRAKDGISLEVRDAGLFEYGLGAYSAEGLLLSKVKHEYIAGCKEQFKENGTVYCVNNFISGAPLGAYLKQQEGNLSEEEAIPMMEKVLLALHACHERKLFHGGISPKAILVDGKGNPKLLGFQSARFKLARESECLKDILKPGYSAPEQTAYEGEEGPWWDIYGSAATLFRMLTGEVLPAATDGWSSSKIKVALYRDAVLSSELCDVLAAALSYSESDRPASVLEFRDMLLQMQKVTHQLHEGDGAPQFEIGYKSEVAPQEAVWQNGVEVTAAKVKIETETVPVAVPLMEENELVDKEMPNVLPSSPPRLLPPANGRDAKNDEVSTQRSSGREQELEVLLTKMVKWQQVFVAFILGIVVIALLGLIGGVFFGPALFQRSGTEGVQITENLTPQQSAEPLGSEAGLSTMAGAASAPIDSIRESTEDNSLADDGVENVGTADDEENAEESSNDAASSTQEREVESRPAERNSTPARQPQRNERATSNEPERREQTQTTRTQTNTATSGGESTSTNNTNNEDPFFTDDDLGIAAEAEEESAEAPRGNDPESLFNYYRAQGDSLMKQGFTTAALQWYNNALKYRANDTYLNEQIASINASIEEEARRVRVEDSLQARLEEVRDQNGIFIMPDTPVVLLNEQQLRSNITYPIAAVNGGVSGRVILRYIVDENGQLIDINIVKGLGWGLEDVVIDLLRQAQFQPATFNGEPVRAWATFTTVFRLNN